MSYNPENEISRLENRIQTQLDLRFNYSDQQTKIIKTNLENLEAKFDKYIQDIEARRLDNSQWLFRQFLITSISFVLGGGALTLVDYIIRTLK